MGSEVEKGITQTPSTQVPAGDVTCCRASHPRGGPSEHLRHGTHGLSPGASLVTSLGLPLCGLWDHVPTGPLCPWTSPGENTGGRWAGFLLQGSSQATHSDTKFQHPSGHWHGEQGLRRLQEAPRGPAGQAQVGAHWAPASACPKILSHFFP